jgi:transcriptional regulator with XRE-family HTH domain
MPARNELTPDRSARHLFGAEMRRLRGSITLEQLAVIVRYSKSSLARFETAQLMPPPDLPAKLDAALGTDGLFTRLYELARKEIHPDQFRRRMELEAGARLIEEYTSQIMPGLLQTEDYARALFETHNPRASAEEITKLVADRKTRQELLNADSAPDLFLVVDEAAVRRPVGGPDVMRAQLARLLHFTLTPTSVVQVLPFSHGAHGLMGGSLTLLTPGDGPQVAYEESITTGTLLEDKSVVARHRRAYDLLRASALSPRDSAAFIRSVLEALPT